MIFHFLDIFWGAYNRTYSPVLQQAEFYLLWLPRLRKIIINPKA